jgi:hypothetical protein
MIYIPSLRRVDDFVSLGEDMADSVWGAAAVLMFKE